MHEDKDDDDIATNLSLEVGPRYLRMMISA